MKLFKDKIIVYVFYSLLALQLVTILIPKFLIITSLLMILLGIFFTQKHYEGKFIYIISFISGIEVYTKQLSADGLTTSIVPWEFSKYAASLICFVFVLKNIYKKRNYGTYFITFFLLCLISFTHTIFFFTEVTFVDIYKKFAVGFINIIVLFFTCFAFDSIKIKSTDLKNIMIFFGLGIFPTTYTLISRLFNLSFINFSGMSNHEFAGYGPVHVSTALSFITGLLIIGTFMYKLWKKKSIMISIILLLTLITLLTFSRSGFMVATPAVLAAYIFYKRNFKLLVTIFFLCLLSFIIIIPLINNLTNGAFQTRYSSISPDSRLLIAKDDLRIFYENPLLGVGYGGTNKEIRHLYNGQSGTSAHTEYTRFLAEQGVIGLLCIILLIMVFYKRLITEKSKVNQPILLFLIIFPFLYFFAVAFRTYLPALSLGLALTKLELES